MFGLSNGDSGVAFADIDFAAYLAGPDLKVYENGTSKGTFGTLSVGDVVRVSVHNNKVRYYLNNTPVYTSTATPTYPLLLDTAITTTNGQVYKALLCTNCQAYYYHTDQLGSVRDLTDSSGSVVNTYEYDAYGVPSSSGTTGTAYNPFGFSGEYKDSETGLIYLRARYYDPATQQFLTRDPLV
jgi:RHS repeat-associated protein